MYGARWLPYTVVKLVPREGGKERGRKGEREEGRGRRGERGGKEEERARGGRAERGGRGEEKWRGEEGGFMKSFGSREWAKIKSS